MATENLKNIHRYGMKYRGFAPGCQPKKSFVRREDDPSGKYYDIIVYCRLLTKEEVREYELDPIAPTNFKRMRMRAGVSQSELEKLTGIKKRTIQHYDQEKGTFNLACLDNALKIAQILKCDVRALMD